MIERGALKPLLERLSNMESIIEDQIRPWKHLADQIDDLRELLTEGHPDIAGKCETCGENVFVGDECYHYEEGIACKEHAPSRQDLIDLFEQNPESFNEPEAMAATIKQWRESGADLAQPVLHTAS